MTSKRKTTKSSTTSGWKKIPTRGRVSVFFHVSPHSSKVRASPTSLYPLDLDEDGIEIEYDADGNPLAPSKDRYIDPLPALDHSEIRYPPFEKNFYNEHADIAGLSNIQVRFIFSFANPLDDNQCLLW